MVLQEELSIFRVSINTLPARHIIQDLHGLLRPLSLLVQLNQYWTIGMVNTVFPFTLLIVTSQPFSLPGAATGTGLFLKVSAVLEMVTPREVILLQKV